MKPYQIIFLLLLVVVIAFSPHLEAQEKTVKPIVLDVAVTNKRNVPIVGLKTEDFRILVGKTEQKIISVENAENEPLSVLILLDVSGSINNAKFKALQEGLMEFTKNCRRCAEFSLVIFNAKSFLWSDFTANKDDFTKSVQRFSDEKPFGNTAFYDALYLSLEKISTGKSKRKMILHIGDGIDNASTRKFPELQNKLKKSGVMFYSITWWNERTNDSSETAQMLLLNELCVDSGAGSFNPKEETQIKLVVEQLIKELDHRYIITFELSDDALSNAEKNKKQFFKVKTDVSKEIKEKYNGVYIDALKEVYSDFTEK